MGSFMKEFQHLEIRLEEIKSATDNFNENKVIGAGGFGKVYKGEVSHSKGRDLVAFKRLDRRYGQGELEFWKEVVMLSRYTHENLISLLAFCSEGSEKIVVYEYASRGSLDRYLSSIDLTWTQRIKICLDAAKGISFLHNDKGTHQILLHRDIKSSNILLDDNWTAKVSDLGLSRIGPANQLYTTLITNVVGTPGYCDPLYMETYSLTKESDVYSFGVVLFEVLCGRLCYEYSNGRHVILVPRWKERYEQKKLDELIFQNLTQQMSHKSLTTFSEIAFQCLHRTREERPRMSLVVEKLEIALKAQRRYDLKLPEEHEEIPAVVTAVGMVTSSFPPAHQYGIQNRFESRESIFKDALKFLNSNNETQKMMALCGMGGVGKTTMMEQLKEVVMDSQKFAWVVKVVIGENTNPIAFQQSIAEKVGESLTETTKDARAERLRNKFLGMSQDGKKKILVIIDDLWKEVDLKDVGLMSPLPKGFKILFTSRFEYVCTQMGVEAVSIFKVGLNVEEAKSLFFGIVGPSVSDNDDPELQKIGEDIAKRCGGLPIAIKTMANNLRDNIEDAWKDALSRLEHHDLQDLDDIVHTVFEMSYNNLKKNEDKAVFLLCGLFPDDFNIRIEDLMRYGWGLKLYNKVYTLAEARRRTNTCVNNLVRANLLTESDEIESVKMHDFVRAFVLSNFSKVKQASIINHDSMSTRLAEDANESYERILLNCTGMAEFPSDLNYQDLSFFMLMNGNKPLKFPRDIYERMEKLKVVSYEKMRIPLLPATSEYSMTLRTLCLHSCRLMDDFSILGSLSNLEILSFAHCKIKKLPSMIGKLKNLKLLDLTGCLGLYIDDGVFQNLVSLEELYMRVFGNNPIRFTDVNCDELGILSRRLSALEFEFFKNKAQPKNVSFQKLDRFMISIGCKFKHNETYSYKKTLHLVADCNDLLECNMSVLFEKTEELHLQVNDMSHLGDLSTCPSQYSFCNLRVLTVFNCSLLTCLFTFPVARGLKKLERLIISKCPVLKVLVDENRVGEVIKFQKLKFMSLKDLPSLISLCDIVNVIELPELLELKLEVLPNFTSVYSDNNNASAMQSLINREVVISKLEKLDIYLMRNLKQIWPCRIDTTEKNTVSMLREVRVRYCDDLVNLFPNNPLPLLNYLEELKVERCGSIEVLFNIDLDCICEIEEHRSRLRNIKVEGLENLRELWRMTGVKYPDILISGFQGVESIEIKDCCIFTNIFSPTWANFDLGGLATYIAHNAEHFDWRNMKSSQESNVIFKEERSERDDDDIPDVTYTSHLVHSCHHLQHLELSGDKRVEVVFDMDSPSSRVLPITQDSHRALLLPYLKVLTLSDLENLHHVWKCNWKKFSISQQPSKLPFHDLTNISLKTCQKLKYLFSPLMAKLFTNLKSVYISSCFSIEEVVSSRDDNMGTFESPQRNNTLFPHLDTLELSGLFYLKRIDGVNTITSINDQFQGARVGCSSWSLCQYPRKISIDSCEALESIIPCYAARQMKRLEKLKISFCPMITEVFESQMINKSTNVDEGSASGGTSTTLASASLQNMIVVPQLSNLKVMKITTCYLLRHAFSFSTLESLKQLKKLSVYECKETKVIVEEEKGAASKVVVFARLETLELVDLPKLKGFFLGMNDIRWPLLDTLIIKDCPQMMVFTSGQSNAPRLKYVSTSLGKHSVEHDHNFHGTANQHDQACLGPTISKQLPAWSFHNLIEIDTPEKYIKSIIPSNALLQLQMLEKIDLAGSYLVEEVFEVAKEGTNNTSGFSESQTVVKVPNLREVYLTWLHELKYIWKSNQGTVLEFPTLTRMSIQNCNSLEHVFTCSMVGSLLQLQELDISHCGTVKVIVKEEQECDAKVNEIMLPRLKSLTLRYLPYLKGFYLGNKAFSWPSMDALEIMECPKVTIFTKGPLATPKLKVIDTHFGKFDLTEDVNSFIHAKQVEGHSL